MLRLLTALLLATPALAVPAALVTDPPMNTAYPANLMPLLIASHGANMNGLTGSDKGFDAGIEVGSSGIGKAAGRFVILLDMDRVLSVSELSALTPEQLPASLEAPK